MRLSLEIFFESRMPASVQGLIMVSLTYTPAIQSGPKKSPLPLSSTPKRGSNNSGLRSSRNPVGLPAKFPVPEQIRRIPACPCLAPPVCRFRKIPRSFFPFPPRNAHKAPREIDSSSFAGAFNARPARQSICWCKRSAVSQKLSHPKSLTYAPQLSSIMTAEKYHLKEIVPALFRWFEANARDLPGGERVILTASGFPRSCCSRRRCRRSPLIGNGG